MAFHYHYYAVRYQETDPVTAPEGEKPPLVTRLVRTMNIVDPLMRVYFDNSDQFKQRKDFYNLEVLKDYGYAALNTLPAERTLNEFLRDFPIEIKKIDK